MTLRLTPENLEAAYELLRRTKPFSGWKLPQAEEVAFRVSASRGLYGFHHSDRQRKAHPAPGSHAITISEATVGTLDTLLRSMAHEMCHIRESQLGPYTGNAHGEMFRRLATQVCRHHGFDQKAF